MGAVLRGDAGCHTVINFGAMYAAPDQSIAEAFPQVEVYAVDRSDNIRAMNAAEFGAPNLHMVADDIINFIKATDVTGGCLVHNRTAMFLMPAMVERVYRTCADAGIRHIVGLEWGGYSHELGRYYDFADRNADSAVLRNAFYAHNYEALLSHAGFTVTTAALHRLPMRKPHQRDAHLFVFRAMAAG